MNKPPDRDLGFLLLWIPLVFVMVMLSPFVVLHDYVLKAIRWIERKRGIGREPRECVKCKKVFELRADDPNFRNVCDNCNMIFPAL